MNIMDIAKAVSKSEQRNNMGLDLAKNLHEQMIGVEDAPFTYEYEEYFKILPMINEWFQFKRPHKRWCA